MLQFKNLPSLREKLDSMKTKHQKASRDPKYNITPMPLKAVSSAAEMRKDIREKYGSRFSPFTDLKKRSEAVN